MNSIIWTAETENYKSSLYSNFKKALSSYIGEDLVNVDSIEQLNNCKNLIVIDEHYTPHRDLITNSQFINLLNKNNIKVIIFNTEKIYNSFWDHNLKTQKKISKINNLVQFLSDVDDISILTSPFPNKQYLSKSVEYSSLNDVKRNEAVFYGQLKGSAYEGRRKILNDFSTNIDFPLDVIESNRTLAYSDYLELISKYKYVLNPLGAGYFVNIRYFETLLVGSIPIQQLSKKMLGIYKELTLGQSINFSMIRDLDSINFENYKPPVFSYYLEDYFYDNQLKSFLD
jgi:hypothetical protein